MAKPIPLAPDDTPNPSTSRPRRRQHSSSSTPSPSSALLSTLAAIVASSPLAASSPAPLSFLCPSIAYHHTPSHTIQQRSTSPSRRIKSRRSPKRFGHSRVLPFKFEPGEDGVWRRVETYTLYGSTVCSQSCQTPTNPISADEVNTSLDNTSNVTDGIKLHDTLPAGWFPVPDPNENRTTLILALSLVLAFFICFFIIGCLFWRKTVRRRHKDGDLELKVPRQSRSSVTIPTNTQPQVDMRKEAKGRQKIWARATARWKQNALYTARQRRGRRPTSTRSQPLDSCTTLHPSVPTETPDDDDDASSMTSRAQSVSRSVSRRTSIESTYGVSPPSSNQPQEPTNNPHTPPSIIVDSSPDPSLSPPAYRQRTLVTPIITPSSGLSVPDEHDGSGSLLPPSPRPSNLSFNASPVEGKSSISAQGSDTPQIPVHAAHVATDDKALLALLSDLAERPPGETPHNAESSHQVSVPVWEDEQLEDFTPESSETGTSGSTPQPPFPPPPAKGKMVEPSFYAYRCSFEEFSESIDPEMGPSAPPFEAPGAPVLGDMIMLPSAPPLVEEDFLLEVYPDAPLFEAAAEADVSPDPPEVNGERSAEHPSTANSRPLSEGTLPGYQP